MGVWIKEKLKHAGLLPGFGLRPQGPVQMDLDEYLTRWDRGEITREHGEITRDRGEITRDPDEMVEELDEVFEEIARDRDEIARDPSEVTGDPSEITSDPDESLCAFWTKDSEEMYECMRVYARNRRKLAREQKSHDVQQLDLLKEEDVKRGTKEFVRHWIQNLRRGKECDEQQVCAMLSVVLHLGQRMYDGEEKSTTVPMSLVVQGVAGTGKSMCIISAVEQYLHFMSERLGQSLWSMVQFCGTTGLAALIASKEHGETVDVSFANRRQKEVLPKMASGNPNLKMVLIDESSMIQGSWLELMEKNGRKWAELHDKQRKGEKFGGLSMVFVGDCHQLNPVKGTGLYDHLQESWESLWIGDNSAERHFLSIVLTKQYRMRGKLAEIAERFATGQQTLEDAQLLQEREIGKIKGTGIWTDTYWSKGGRLLASTQSNKTELNKVVTEAMVEDIKCCVKWRAVDKPEKAFDRGQVVEQLSEETTVWKGQSVMLMQSQCNGKLRNGVVVVVVQVGGGRIISKQQQETSGMVEVKVTMPDFVVVAEPNVGESGVEMMERHERQGLDWKEWIKQDQQHKGPFYVLQPEIVKVKGKGSRKTFAFTPVFASTVHKGQGQTLKNGVICLLGQMLEIANQFTVFHFNTTLTRPTTLEQLGIIGMLPSSVFLSWKFPPEVHLEMKRLNRMQDQQTMPWLLDQMREMGLIVNTAQEEEDMLLSGVVSHARKRIENFEVEELLREKQGVDQEELQKQRVLAKKQRQLRARQRKNKFNMSEKQSTMDIVQLDLGLMDKMFLSVQTDLCCREIIELMVREEDLHNMYVWLERQVDYSDDDKEYLLLKVLFGMCLKLCWETAKGCLPDLVFEQYKRVTKTNNENHFKDIKRKLWKKRVNFDTLTRDYNKSTSRLAMEDGDSVVEQKIKKKKKKKNKSSRSEQEMIRDRIGGKKKSRSSSLVGTPRGGRSRVTKIIGRKKSNSRGKKKKQRVRRSKSNNSVVPQGLVGRPKKKRAKHRDN